MINKRVAFAFVISTFFSFGLAGCALSLEKSASLDELTQGSGLATAYDYALLDQDLVPTRFSDMIQVLREYDVVFLGEYHGNHASHLLQMQVFAALYQRNESMGRESLLSLEMFNRDQEAQLEKYVDGEIGERYLIEETPAWNNYAASYRPLVEFAKQNLTPIIASNAAADMVRCIGRFGEGYYEKMTDAEKAMIAQRPFEPVEGYEEKFMAFMSSAKRMSKEQRQNAYLAQLTRDNTMAESIFIAMEEDRNRQVIHLNGRFHSAEHLGTAGALKRMNPKLNIAVVTPVYPQNVEDLKSQATTDEFYYLVTPQPDEFVDAAYKRKVRKSMFDKAKDKAKNCR